LFLNFTIKRTRLALASGACGVGRKSSLRANFGQVESSEALIHLATSGRKRGFGAIFATQRLSQLSKAKRR
jgi:hypothetical protein